MNVFVSNLKCQLVPTSGKTAEELTVADSVVTATGYEHPVSHVLISVKAQPVLVTFDGTDPAVGGAGIYYETGARDIWPIERLARAKWIRYGSSSATVRIEPMNKR